MLFLSGNTCCSGDFGAFFLADSDVALLKTLVSSVHTQILKMFILSLAGVLERCVFGKSDFRCGGGP